MVNHHEKTPLGGICFFSNHFRRRNFVLKRNSFFEYIYIYNLHFPLASLKGDTLILPLHPSVVPVVAYL